LHLACPTRSKGDWSPQWLRPAAVGCGNWIWVDNMTTKEKLILLTIFLVSCVVSLTIMFGFAKLIKYFWEYL
jgi:hypothetical protein